jgi:hypothetical protein
MTDPTIASWSRENDLLFQLRQLREENERLREDQQGVDAIAVLTEEGWTWDGNQWQRPASPAVINMENFVGSGKPVVRMMNDSVIAGALFDFMGWLTSRKNRLVLSSVDEASPAVDAIRDFAKMRGLSLDDAMVQDWQNSIKVRT